MNSFPRTHTGRPYECALGSYSLPKMLEQKEQAEQSVLSQQTKSKSKPLLDVVGPEPGN